MQILFLVAFRYIKYCVSIGESKKLTKAPEEYMEDFYWLDLFLMKKKTILYESFLVY